MGEEEKEQYILVKDFNTFMYFHSLHRGREYFCRYCLHAFINKQILNRHIKDWFKINDEQRTVMPQKREYVKFKNFEEKIKSPFIIYTGFESILVSEENEKQNPNDSFTNKYQKHVACRYGYKLVCPNDKFSKPFKSYLGKDFVYNFISSFIEESKYCSDAMNKHFNKNLVMTKKENENYEKSTKYCISDDEVIETQLIEIVISILN